MAPLGFPQKPALDNSSCRIASAARSRCSRSAVTSPRQRTVKPGTRERLPPNQRFRQPERFAHRPHFILEQITQRLDQFELHILRQAAYIMMGLDLLGLVPVRRRRLDHIRIDRPLHQEPWLAQLSGLLFEQTDEFLADDPSLLLRLGHTLQGADEIRRRHPP